jgi:hypothetical protein
MLSNGTDEDPAVIQFTREFDSAGASCLRPLGDMPAARYAKDDAVQAFMSADMVITDELINRYGNVLATRNDSLVFLPHHTL